jgi:3-hydroxyisobutyrate dehydrogenase-like beta-hydroxyacid dehydrogenase
VNIVGIISPGDMGSAIGRVLGENGMDVVACLEGRSDLTRVRAEEAGLRILPTLHDVVRTAEIILCVTPPVEAPGIAERVAVSMKTNSATPTYVDCNAISPGTAQRIGALVNEAGATFIDAGIIGPPPGPGRPSRFSCSGPDTAAFEELGTRGLKIRMVGREVGQASALKMVYAASTKGSAALWTELMVAAKALGVGEELAYEFSLSRSELAQHYFGEITSMPHRAKRWIGEMEEIAATFEDVGLTPRIFQGVADIFRMVSETSLADQTSREPDPPLETVLETLAEQAQTNR